jgi:succinate dehydrogenase / fumarate reductase membrane anchor subunit
VQRATALYLALFGVYLGLHFALAPPTDHAALIDWVTRPWVALGLLLFVPTALAHAWVGIRDVLMDYLRATGLRVAALTIMAFVFTASGLWALQAIIVAQLS